MLSTDNNRRKATAKNANGTFFFSSPIFSRNGRMNKKEKKMKINNECVERKAIYGAMPKLFENWSMEIINTIKLKDVYINLKRFLLLVKQREDEKAELKRKIFFSKPKTKRKSYDAMLLKKTIKKI